MNTDRVAYFENWHVRAVPVDLATEIRHKAVDLRMPVNQIVIDALRHWLEHANSSPNFQYQPVNAGSYSVSSKEDCK